MVFYKKRQKAARKAASIHVAFCFCRKKCRLQLGEVAIIPRCRRLFSACTIQNSSFENNLIYTHKTIAIYFCTYIIQSWDAATHTANRGENHEALNLE